VIVHRYSTWKRFSCLFCCSVGRRSGNYLAFGYTLIKLLYIANAIGQLFLLNVFMGGRFHLYGLEILQKWFYSQPIEAVERFPRITMCRFILRTLGDNIQSYDVQCLLPNNIYNEKVGQKEELLVGESMSTKYLDLSAALVLACVCCDCFDLWFIEMVPLLHLTVTQELHPSFSESKWH
jgi:hypothetical protein